MKKKKTESATSVEEPPNKKNKIIEEVTRKLFFLFLSFLSLLGLSFNTTVDDTKMEDLTKDTAMEAEVKAAQQRAVIPIEERVQQFKEMLAEKEVIFPDFQFFRVSSLCSRFLPQIGFCICYMGKRTS